MTAIDKRKSQVQGPRAEVQGPKSKVQGPRSKVPLRGFSRCAALGVALLAGLFLLSLFSGSGRAQSGSGGAGAFFIPGNAKAGMVTFSDKGCVRCHSVFGEGGRSAPDLARAPAGHLSAAELVAGMWNHAPAMWEVMRAENVSRPSFSKEEMANLFAFLYSVRSLDEAGDAERGRRLLAEKRCLDCHSVAGEGGRIGPDLKNWASYRNPVSWLQAMWNQAPVMHERMAKQGVKWPEFQGNDVADLIAYIRARAPAPKTRIYLTPGDADSGKRLFQNKGCARCHGIRSATGNRAPDLGMHGLPRTLGQFAGLMWNHAPMMWSSMRQQGVTRPQFSNREMADLITYLFAQRYFEASGNVEHGRRIFGEKGCTSCHSTGTGPSARPAPGRAGGPVRAGSPAPELAQLARDASSIPLATALWNHGPLMLQEMKKRGMPWPSFRPGEITHLMEFLSNGQAAAPARVSEAGSAPASERAKSRP